MIIAFAGHRKVCVTEELKEKIRETIEKHLPADEVLFYCGGYGDFDNACAGIARALKTVYPHIRLVFVTPYIQNSYVARIKESGLYDEILYPDLESVPYRFAISRRNEYMVTQADLLIAYVECDWGGAYKTLQYAKRKHKKVINLAER